MDDLTFATHQLLQRQEQSGSNNSRAGTARNSTPSISALVSTLVPSLIIFVIFFTIFLLLRRNIKRIYIPRTYIRIIEPWRRISQEEYLGEEAGGYLGWIPKLWKIPETAVLRSSGLDGYFFLRYLQRACFILFFGCCLTFPILFPINITGGNGMDGLEILTFSNVRDGDRLYAHVFVGIIFFSFVLYTVYRELIFYTTLKQAYLLSPMYSSRISARTVLITSIPEKYLNESALLRIFDHVARIWINTDTKEIEKLVEERDKVALRLEAAEVELIKMADEERRNSGNNAADSEENISHHASGNSASGASRWLNHKKRPSHRLKPIVGRKVDTIDWCRSRLSELLPKIEQVKAKYAVGDVPKINSAFIEFTSQYAAQAALQVLAHHQPLHMAPRYIGIAPEEVVWSNMQLKWGERLVRIWASTAFVVALIVFWSVPVAAIGAISQVDALAEYSWLSWINDIPTAILGIITGLLPAVLLAILMALLPVFLRFVAKVQGAPSLSHVELRTQSIYFAFQVIQVFLVTTLSAGVFTSLKRVADDPSNATTILARSLPKASNFFIAFLILQGFLRSGAAFMQFKELIMFKLRGRSDGTPRKKWTRSVMLSGAQWGTIFPIYTNLCVIALSYSIIAPLVMGFGTIALFLLYFAYRYNLLFVYNTGIDTKGAIYHRALYQTLTGVYLAQLCLIGLFSIKKAFGPLVIQIVFLIFTILVHLSIASAFHPLLEFLPRSVGNEVDTPIEELESQPRPSIPRRVNDKPSIDGGQQAAFSTGGPDMTAPNGQTDGKPGLLSRFFRPEKHFSYDKVRPLVPVHDRYGYTPEQARDAYIHPAINTKVITVWVPRDGGGVSKHEIAETRRVLAANDEGAWFDEKGNLVRDEKAMPPGWVMEPRY